jgi:coenzyme F420-reducing hydrogenase delta subunit
MTQVETECQFERTLYKDRILYTLIHMPTKVKEELAVEKDNIELVYENADEEDKIFYILLNGIVEKLKKMPIT